jgi:histidinol phosphatase-like PHP family hydrolase
MEKVELGKRFEFHSHSMLSDGVLSPSQLIQRANAAGYELLALTDHADVSTLEQIVRSTVKVVESVQRYVNVKVIPGVELTHVPPLEIEKAAQKARRLGASLVLVHGETPVEPVATGTNAVAVNCDSVDILAHPGLITKNEAEKAKESGVYLELTYRKGHCLFNGLVAKMALRVGARMLVNTDLHEPWELISQRMAFDVAMGAGLNENEALEVVRNTPRQLLKEISARK